MEGGEGRDGGRDVGRGRARENEGKRGLGGLSSRLVFHRLSQYHGITSGALGRTQFATSSIRENTVYW
jgi:hypothetical protein